jgi:cell division protein ZapA (FtsZ GTPase activity inhibitor)
MNEPRVVNVEIAGEEYAIRTLASEEYTQECAAHVDRKIAEIMSAGGLIQAHKAGILAALAVTDELLQSQSEATALRAEVERLSAGLVTSIEARLASSDLAAGS